MTPEDEQQRARQGILLAIGAYTMWGIAPMYFKSIAQVSPLEILSHRVIWSFFLLAALLHFAVTGARLTTSRKTKRKSLT